MILSVFPVLLTALAPALAPQEAVPAPQRAVRGVLVGCTEYPYLKEAGHAPGSNVIELRGPVHDVDLFARALRDTFAVPESAFTRLAGWPEDEKARPTKANIVRALQGLAASAQAEDWVIVYLAGHGSQQPSGGASLDDEPDGLDEIFLPADVRPAPDGTKVPNALSDDEIADLVRRIRAKGADVWLVVDACHSGTLLRGGDWVLRSIEPSKLGLRGTAPRPAAAEKKPMPAGSLDGVVAFYGAQSFGSAPEMELPEGAPDARPHGLFTYLLARELTRVTGTTTYSELAQRVTAAYQAFPCHLTVPLAEGDLQRVVGGREREPTPPLLLTIGSGPPRLNLGLLAGVEPGVQLEVAPADDPSGRPIARLEVVSAGLYEAECALKTGALPEGPATCRAVVVSRSLGEFRLSLAVVDPDEHPLGLSALPEATREFLEREAQRFPLASEPERADWRIVVDGEKLHLRAAGHVGSSDRFDIDPKGLRRDLERILKVHNLRRLCALFPAPDDGLTVLVERRARGATQVERLAAGDVLRPGDDVRILLSKSGDSIYDVTVLYLDANYGVQCLFPTGGKSVRLEREAKKDFELTPWIPVTDDALGVESLWVFAAPRGPSDPQIDLAWLQEDGVPLTRGSLDRDAASQIFRGILGGAGLRGISAGAPPSDGSVYQVPVATHWPALGPPAWGKGGPKKLELALAALADLPVAFDAGTRWSIVASGARGARGDVLLLGDEAAPRAVLIDFGVGGAADPSQFEPEAAFLFPPGGGRIALYDRRDGGGFDLALGDADGDGQAEQRWTRGPEGWKLQDRVFAPWLSQAHLAFLKDKPAATARLRILARE